MSPSPQAHSRSLAAKLSAMVVVLDITAFGALGIVAAVTEMHIRKTFDLWANLHWPAVVISEALFPGPYSMHDPIPYGLVTVFASVALAQAALVGWVVGKVVEMLRNGPHHAL